MLELFDENQLLMTRLICRTCFFEASTYLGCRLVAPVLNDNILVAND
jgi:hypothetical protein